MYLIFSERKKIKLLEVGIKKMKKENLEHYKPKLI